MTELDYKRKASEFLQKGRYDDAVAQYRALIENSKKKNPAILNLIGDIYVKQSAYELAFESFVEASRLYAEEGLFHNGIAVGKKVLRLDKEQTEVYGILGNLYARQGLGMDCIKFLSEFARKQEIADEYPSALAAFAEACEVLTDCPEIHVAYGEMLEKVGRGEDAATCFLNASQVFADKGDTASADQWSAKARDARDSLDEDTSGVQSVADLMNLRTLDDDAPRSTVAEGSESADEFWGRPDEPAGLTLGSEAPTGASPASAPPVGATPGVDNDAPWARFDPNANPQLPPPPPLPGQGLAAPAIAAQEVVADPNEMFQEPAGLGDAGSDGLTLDVGTDPMAANADGAYTIDIDIDTAPSDESPVSGGLELTSDVSPASGGLELTLDEPSAVEEDAPALDTLPGVVMPEAAGSQSTEAATPIEDATPTEAAAPTDESAPAATPPATPEGIAPADEDLAAFFDTAADSGPSDDQAVVIGDDFELLREGGDVREVIADFRAATDEILDLDDYQAHYDLGTTYLEMELFDEAAAEFEVAARGDGWTLASQEMLGYCFLRKGQIDLAVKELEKGLNTPGFEERDRLGLLYNLGIARGVLDDEQEAIAAFQRILEVEPDFRDAATRLERIVQNAG